MTIKQMLFSTLIIAASNVLSAENTEQTKSRTFKLDTKTIATNPPVPGDTKVFSQDSESRYRFKVAMSPEEIRQMLNDNDTKSCVYCPLIKSMIVDTDNLYDCDALNVALLSDDVRLLRKKLLDAKKAITDVGNSL